MDFRQAEQFLAVVDHGGVGRAAEALSLSQPTLSQTIKVLEREAGCPLFHRVGHGLVLTPEGHALVRPARRLLLDVDAARASISDVTGVLRGHLAIAAIGASVERLVPVLGHFRRLHPNVTLEMVCPEVERAVVTAVQERRSELGFMPLPWSNSADPADLELLASGVVVEKWGADEVVLVLPPGEYPHLDDPLSAELLPDLPTVAVPDGAYARFAVEAVLRKAQVRTVTAVVTAHRDMLMPLVEHGVGMAFTLAEYGHAAARRGAVLRRLVPTIDLDYGVVYPTAPLSPVARTFLDHAREHIRGRADA